jgi:hypothetical protein
MTFFKKVKIYSWNFHVLWFKLQLRHKFIGGIPMYNCSIIIFEMETPFSVITLIVYKRGDNLIETRLQNVFLQWWKFLNQTFRVGFNVHYKIKNASWRQRVAIEVCRLFCHLMTIAFPKICYKESEIMITSLHPINKVSRVV